MDFEHKRRAVYTGLSPFFEGDALTSAVKLWEKEYSYKPHYGYSEFLSKISKTKDLRLQRMKMLGSIFVALDQPKQALMHVDFAAIPKSTRADKRCLVFESFINNLLSNVPSIQAKILRSSIVQALLGLDLDAFQLDALGQFLDQEVHDLMIDLDLISMRSIINEIEKQMQATLGRSQADEAFIIALRQTKSVSDQYDFNLNHLYQ